MGAYTGGSVSVTQMAEPEQVQSLFVTQGVLPILRLKPVIGRLFTSQDDTDGTPQTVLISYGYWQKNFAGSPSVLGRRMMIDGEAHEVIGVLPARFWYANLEPALVLPLRFNRNKVFLGNFSFQGIARLKHGVRRGPPEAYLVRSAPSSSGLQRQDL